jgi:hypothetical protein
MIEEGKEMRRFYTFLALSLPIIFGLTLQAQAFTITYPVTDTNYAITNVSGHNVKEDYNAQSLLKPFPSHGGAAVVDFSGEGAPIYFDKVITFDDKDSKSNFELTFDVTNGIDKGANGKYTWDDYHFILINPQGVKFTSGQSAEFKGVTVSDTEVDLCFYPPGGKVIVPGDEGHFNLSLSIPDIPNGTTLIIELRQIATDTPVVPLPSTVLLLSSGLLGLVGWRRFRKG